MAELGFEPGSPSWEAGTLSITPQDHAQGFLLCIYKHQANFKFAFRSPFSQREFDYFWCKTYNYRWYFIFYQCMSSSWIILGSLIWPIQYHHTTTANEMKHIIKKFIFSLFITILPVHLFQTFKSFSLLSRMMDVLLLKPVH